VGRTGLISVFTGFAEFLEVSGDGVVSGGSSSSRDAINQYSASVNRVTIAIGMMSRLKVIEFKGHCQLPRSDLNMGFDFAIENDLIQVLKVGFDVKLGAASHDVFRG